MEKLKETLRLLVGKNINKIIISKPIQKSSLYKKIVVVKKKDYFQAAKYTEKQVFHENLGEEALLDFLFSTVCNEFLQVNAWDGEKEHILLLSKKGKITYKTKKAAGEVCSFDAHNRRKNYLLTEGQRIPP